MIYNAMIQIQKENVQYYQNIKIEAHDIEELFEKIKTVCFLFEGYIESINITQEMKREYSKSRMEKKGE